MTEDWYGDVDVREESILLPAEIVWGVLIGSRTIRLDEVLSEMVA